MNQIGRVARTVFTLRFRNRLCLLLEFFGELDVVKKRPRIIELVIPRPLEVSHRHDHIVDFLISHQRQ